MTSEGRADKSRRARFEARRRYIEQLREMNPDKVLQERLDKMEADLAAEEEAAGLART